MMAAQNTLQNLDVISSYYGCYECLFVFELFITPTCYRVFYLARKV